MSAPTGERARKMERDAIVAWLRWQEADWKDRAYRTSFFGKLKLAFNSRGLLLKRRGLFFRFLKTVLFDQKSIAATYGVAADAIERGDHSDAKS